MGGSPTETTEPMALEQTPITGVQSFELKKRRTIIIREIGEGEEVGESLKVHLLSCPFIEDTPDFVLRPDINGHWFLTMPSEDLTAKAALWLRQTKFCGETMRVGIKSEASRVAIHSSTMYVEQPGYPVSPYSESVYYQASNPMDLTTDSVMTPASWQTAGNPKWQHRNEAWTPSEHLELPLEGWNGEDNMTPANYQKQHGDTPGWTDYSQTYRRENNTFRKPGNNNTSRNKRVGGKRDDQPTRRARGARGGRQVNNRRGGHVQEDSPKNSPPSNTQVVPSPSEFPSLEETSRKTKTNKDMGCVASTPVPVPTSPLPVA